MESAWHLLHENRKIGADINGPTILTEAGDNKLHFLFDGSTHVGQDGADVLGHRIVSSRRESRVYSVRNS